MLNSESNKNKVAEKRFLHLRIFIPLAKQPEFLTFLKKAKPFYEKPGGISVQLYQEINNPEKFIEVIEYDSQEIFNEDQLRVENDNEMKVYLEQWRTILSESIEVEYYNNISNILEMKDE